MAKQGKFGPYLQLGTKGKIQYVSIPTDVWKRGITQKDVKDILTKKEKETLHVNELMKADDAIDTIKQGPRGWYVSMKPVKGKKKRITKSLKGDIMSITSDMIRDMLP